MDKKLYDKRKKPDCKKEQQRKEIFSTYSELCPQKPQDNRLSGLETGNKKTGKSGRIYDKILVWNIPPRITCPGVSDWCSTHCYNADARKDVYTIDRWCENLWDFHFRLPELKDKIENQINETTGRCAVRLHSSGDFFSEEYIDFWKEIILEFPKVSFWGYTRTWNVPCLKDNVNELRKILTLLFRLLQRAGGQFKSCPRYKNGIYSIGSCESGNAGEKIHNLAVCRC